MSFQEEKDIHNCICVKFILYLPVWQGCPYPMSLLREYNRELFKCNLCDLEFIRLKEKDDSGKEVLVHRHWQEYLEEKV